jgi:predicted metal-dependent enzyme (double-stranded beta helix superfamily)
VIHTVHNPTDRYTAAIHVYGGDLLGTARSQWDARTSTEEPYDFELLREEFARAEREYAARDAR